MSNVHPDFLKKGDRVSIVATARKITPEELAPAIAILQGWGLKVESGPELFEVQHQFAGADEIRLSALQQSLNDPGIKAIFCARGGYGTPRIIDSIQWDNFFRLPKWVVGFSDVTILLTKIEASGFCSLHAPMPLFFAKQEYASSVNYLKSFLFGEKLSYTIQPNILNRPGKSSGPITGGNLSLLVNSLATPTAIQAKNKVLFLEDIDEYLYHIDRMMLQLKRAGVLADLNGLLVGHFSDMKDNQIPFGESAQEIINRHVAEYAYPVVFGFPCGHDSPNLPVPIGALCTIHANNTEVKVDFS